jgi:hypothetical protein
MAAYLPGVIVFVGIPPLLYCLWHFANEIRPHKSAFSSSRSPQMGGALRVIRMSQFKVQSMFLNPATGIAAVIRTTRLRPLSLEDGAN